MKDKKILGIIVGVVLVVLVMLGVWHFTLKDNRESDALKFKNEYEALNGTTTSSNKARYNDVNVDEKNPIKYINCKEAIDVLDKEEAIIYVGAPWCPWCRNAVPVLFDVDKSYDNKTIYYLDLDEEKSTYEVKDEKLVKTKDGSSDYYKLLDKLSDRLRDYVLTKDGKSYETGEKRIYMPYVIGVKDGKVVGDHTGTVTLNEEQTKYDSLTSEQYNELYETYSNMFQAVYGKSNEVCGFDTCE